MDEENRLEARLEKLEKRSTRMNFLVGVLILLIVTFIPISLRTRDVLKARQFELRDNSGNLLAKLYHADSQTCLELSGAKRASLALLCVDDEYGSGLDLITDHGTTRAALSASITLREGPGTLAPGLTILQQDGKNLFNATVGDETRLFVGHGSGKNSIVLSSSGNSPTVSIVNQNGKDAWVAPPRR